MFGADYVTVVGFLCDGFVLCRECAQKREDRGNLRLYTEDAQAYYQYQADAEPEDEELTCEDCGRQLGGEE